MNDKDLETLVNTCADASDYGGLDTSTMYGEFALDVAKAVRDACAMLARNKALHCDNHDHAYGASAARDIEDAIRGA